MRYCFLVTLATLFSLSLFAQEKVNVYFPVREHNFGVVIEEGGNVSYKFQFTNKGRQSVSIKRVQTGCGCTSPAWNDSLVNKGESGYITVSYDPMYRPGLFDREVVVTFQSDGKEMIDTLRVLGEVIARPKTLNEQFPYRLDKVQCSCKMIYLKYVDMGTTPSQHLYCHNSSEKPVTMKVTQNHIVEVSEERTIAPGETENFLVTYHSTNGLYGVNMFRLKVILDGDTLMQGINVRAEVKEDFSKLTPKERRKAPIIHALKTPNMTVKRGEQIAYPLTIFNNGLSTLLLRRIVTNGDFITLLTTKNKIKAGRSLNLMLNIDTSKLEPGNYKRKITIISNDPTQPELNHEIEFTVEP